MLCIKTFLKNFKKIFFQIQREKMLARESLFEVELQKNDSLDEELFSILVRQARYRVFRKIHKKIAIDKLGVFHESWRVNERGSRIILH